MNPLFEDLDETEQPAKSREPHLGLNRNSVDDRSNGYLEMQALETHEAQSARDSSGHQSEAEEMSSGRPSLWPKAQLSDDHVGEERV